MTLKSIDDIGLSPKDLLIFENDKQTESLYSIPGSKEILRAMKLQLLSGQFTRASVNGNFVMVNDLFKNVAATADLLSNLRKVKNILKKNGWKEVSFNVWQGNLVICLWDLPVRVPQKSHFEGKPVPV